MRLRLLLFVLISQLHVHAQTAEQRWIDSMLSTMSLDEKFGQLFIIRSYANGADSQAEVVINQIRDYHVGGVCFFKGTVPHLVHRIQQYQNAASIPLMMSMDAEWGAGMRLTDVVKFPKQITLGALRDNRQIYEMGRLVAAQLKNLGIHMNFAPVVDINNNLNNPVINERSFGSNHLMVTVKAFAYMQGMQDGGILACLKHFPGHGDTDVDSHMDVPEIPYSRSRLDSLELFPFSALIHQKPAAVMVGHLRIPSLDTGAHVTATLSASITEGILRAEYGYKGLIITDALEMKGVTKYFTAAEIAVRAFEAGNDMLLLSEDVPAALEALKQALADGRISEKALHEKLQRILAAKFKLGLDRTATLAFDSIQFRQLQFEAEAMNDRLYRNAICLVRDPGSLVPIKDIPARIVGLSIGLNGPMKFEQRLEDYAQIDHYFISDTSQMDTSIRDCILEADLLIIHVHKLNYKSRLHFGLKPELLQQLNPIIQKKKSIVILFGCPYVSMYLPQSASVLLAFEDHEVIGDITAQMLFGTDPISGRSPLEISNVMQGQGIQRPSMMRMGFSVPEAQGMNRDSLHRIDSIANELISRRAAPGCQVLVARNNKIVYRKSYGYLTYDSTELVTDRTMYDLASLTKVCCTAPVLFQLEDAGKIQFTNRFSDYLPEFKGTNKEGLSLKDFMLHQGKLLAWIPFYKSTLPAVESSNGYGIQSYYDSIPSRKFSIPICNRFYLRTDYRDSIWAQILSSRLQEERKYLYSDLGFYFIPKLVQKITGQQFDRYYKSHFADALGLRYTCFNPLSKHYEVQQIAPSEDDTYWRRQRVQGFVHDMGAAMMGGISGHAGLFSNATEVAYIMQMFLNRGYITDREVLTFSSLDKALRRDPEFSRRALLFDMPELVDSTTAYVSSLASKRTFGHQGFTGTCTWLDPDAKINYVFLSNRSFPDSKINLLHKERYRTKIQDLIYRSLFQRQELNVP